MPHGGFQPENSVDPWVLRSFQSFMGPRKFSTGMKAKAHAPGRGLDTRRLHHHSPKPSQAKT